jgi:hypothetical protein
MAALMDFLTLRREIHEELIFFSNADPPNMGTKHEYGDEAYDREARLFEDAQKKIRQLGSKLSSQVTFLNTFPCKLVSYLLPGLGYKPDDAAKQLLWLSAAYEDEDRAIARYRVEIALRFPLSGERYAKYVLEMRERRREEAALRRQSDPAKSS